MPTVSHSTSSRYCRVVVARRDHEAKRVETDYADLSRDAQAELEAIVGCRRYPVLIAPDELRAVRERHGTPPLAFLQTTAGPDALEVPTPVATDFTPLKLDDSQAALESLLGTGVAEDVLRGEPPAHGELRRAVAPYLVPIVSLTWLAAWATGLWLAWSELAAYPARASVGVTCFGVAMFTYWLLVVQVARAWYLLPGGLARRRIGSSLMRWRWERFTPTDTVLSVIETEAGWRATLDTGGIVHRMALTRLEVAALLAAWTGDLAPPTLAELERPR